MPAVTAHRSPDVDPDALRVLVTGFGPFSRYTENPSWLAAKRLHNAVLAVDIDVRRASTDGADAPDGMDIPPPESPARPRQIHVSTVMIPVTYEAVLAVVPGLHARPPVVHASDDAVPLLPPPRDGYDFIFHVGVAGRGPLRLERLGHKLGYRMKDADGKLAPVVEKAHQPNGSGNGNGPEPPTDALVPHSGAPTPVHSIDMSIGVGMNDLLNDIIHGVQDAQMRTLLGGGGGDGAPDVDQPIVRGFGKGYETFPDEIHTEVDVEKLVHYIKESGIERVYTSMDAGHFICDHCYYASLAEAKRTSSGNHRGRHTRVLFMHCPPVGQPLTTDEVAEAIERIIVWVCSGT